jgi:hypothetical protein
MRCWGHREVPQFTLGADSILALGRVTALIAYPPPPSPAPLASQGSAMRCCGEGAGGVELLMEGARVVSGAPCMQGSFAKFTKMRWLVMRTSSTTRTRALVVWIHCGIADRRGGGRQHSRKSKEQERLAMSTQTKAHAQHAQLRDQHPQALRRLTCGRGTWCPAPMLDVPRLISLQTGSWGGEGQRNGADQHT